MTKQDIAARLRDIAGKLRADGEEGAFAPCLPPVQDDMGSLPYALEEIARELEGRREVA